MTTKNGTDHTNGTSGKTPARGPRKIHESMDLNAGLPYFPYMDTRDLFAEAGPYGFMDGSSSQQLARLDNRMAGELLPTYINWWQLKVLRDRSRQIARNNEFAIAAINAHRNYVVGTGFTYQVIARKADTHPEIISRVQELLDLFIEHNKMGDVESEIIYRLHTEGEAFLRSFVGDDGLLRVRFVEPELVRPPADDSTPNSSFGVVCSDEDIHHRTHYWVVQKPWESTTPTLVPAHQILHLRLNVESNSKRGLPTIYAVESNLRASEDVLQSMIALAKARSKIAVIRKVNDSPPEAISELTRTATDYTLTDATQSRSTSINHMGYGSILTSTGNVDYEFPSLNVGSGDMVEVLNCNLRAIAARFGITETMMSTDASNNNYASALVAEAPAVKTFERMQKMLSQAIGERRTKPDRALAWQQISHAVNIGMLPREALTEITIKATGPSLISRDKTSEANVAKTYIDLGLWSPQTVTADSGKDYEEEQRNIKKAKDAAAASAPTGQPDQQGGASPLAPGASPGAAPDQAQTTAQVVQDTALNGAQVQSLVDLATKVAARELSVGTAKAIAQAAFPTVPAEVVNRIFVEVGPEQAQAVAQADAPKQDDKPDALPTKNESIREGGKYDHIDFTPPKGAREAAGRSLKVRAEKPDSEKGMTPVGVARARDLINGRKVSPDTARRMKAFFDRHEVDKKGSTWDQQGKGWQAWQGWGGDAGYSWAKKIVAQMDAADKPKGAK